MDSITSMASTAVVPHDKAACLTHASCDLKRCIHSTSHIQNKELCETNIYRQEIFF